MAIGDRKVDCLFQPGDRLLVLGGSGWFGRTLLSMVPEGIPILATASSRRDGFIAWNERDVRRFCPTVVANFALLTRDKIASVGPREFEAINSRLTDQFLHTCEQPDVTRAVTVSSGAASENPTSLYGRLKLAEESASLERANEHRVVTVLRAYSVSGPYVVNPDVYAFSSMIMGAASGVISVQATVPTYRRYVKVTDLLRVALAWGKTGVIESGGSLVEMGELARKIAQVVNPSTQITRPPLVSDEPDVYASNNESWASACSELAFTAAHLDQQIEEASEWLLGPRQ